jgi:hypothetical protein
MNERSEDAFARLRLASAGDQPTRPTDDDTHDFNSTTRRSTLNSLSRDANAEGLKTVQPMGSTSDDEIRQQADLIAAVDERPADVDFEHDLAARAHFSGACHH